MERCGGAVNVPASQSEIAFSTCLVGVWMALVGPCLLFPFCGINSARSLLRSLLVFRWLYWGKKSRERGNPRNVVSGAATPSSFDLKYDFHDIATSRFLLEQRNCI